MRFVRVGVLIFSKSEEAGVKALKIADLALLVALVTIMSFPTVAQSLSPTGTGYPTTSAGGLTAIVTGSDGALWFTEHLLNKVGRVTTAGIVTEYSLPPYLGSALIGTLGPYGIASGSDGALWFVAVGEIGRITTTGAATFFPIPGIAYSVASGPDGALWFTGTNNGVGYIGRVTMSGTLTEFDLPASSGATVGGITSGPDGAMWFIEIGYGAIGRITMSGTISHFPVSNLGEVSSEVNSRGIVSGPDNALWFADGASIGRMTTTGSLTVYHLDYAHD